ncbi:hypothetical protein ACFYWO_32470 [Streptomyces sp. NPDC002932]|uniref:hypothetical protein n=1 Tax=Streptomyces sp. NPDC002932 TaxID=3364672 RepID=UPI0036871A69
MTCIEDLLSRALLVGERAVPRDIVPALTRRTAPDDTSPLPNTAAQDLHGLCETLVKHTPGSEVADFLTEQVPEPRSALILACVLELTDTPEGARFWWEYAAGAGQSAAAYCLYLHHLALGERETADWWHQQTDDVQEQTPTSATQPEANWHPGNHLVASSSTSTILRVLRHLSRHVSRPRSAVVAELMEYMPTAVSIGYLREPDVDLPLPGNDFAARIVAVLDSADQRPNLPDGMPARNATGEDRRHRNNAPASECRPAAEEEEFHPWGETATR